MDLTRLLQKATGLNRLDSVEVPWELIDWLARLPHPTNKTKTKRTLLHPTNKTREIQEGDDVYSESTISPTIRLQSTSQTCPLKIQMLWSGQSPAGLLWLLS